VALLLERALSRRRWEISIKDIDREQVQRIVEAARSSGRIVGPVGFAPSLDAPSAGA
jgi:ATP-dependent DNA helicase RecG